MGNCTRCNELNDRIKQLESQSLNSKAESEHHIKQLMNEIDALRAFLKDQCNKINLILDQNSINIQAHMAHNSVMETTVKKNPKTLILSVKHGFKENISVHQLNDDLKVPTSVKKVEEVANKIAKSITNQNHKEICKPTYPSLESYALKKDAPTINIPMDELIPKETTTSKQSRIASKIDTCQIHIQIEDNRIGAPAVKLKPIESCLKRSYHQITETDESPEPSNCKQKVENCITSNSLPKPALYKQIDLSYVRVSNISNVSNPFSLSLNQTKMKNCYL